MLWDQEPPLIHNYNPGGAMDFANEKFLELAFSLAGSSILALIGFVWKISHRVSAL